MTHTPGPWKRVDSQIVSEAEWFVEPIDGEDGIPTCVADFYGSMGGDDSNADLNLMAAAPDLLEALEAMCKPFANVTTASIKGAVGKGVIPALGRISPKDALQARTAIAKAKGESS